MAYRRTQINVGNEEQIVMEKVQKPGACGSGRRDRYSSRSGETIPADGNFLPFGEEYEAIGGAA